MLLGLTPTLLAAISPSVGEISLLSSNRPLLSFLLSPGGPSVFCFRTLSYDDPLERLREADGMFQQEPLRRQGAKEFLVSMCQYLLALASIANVVELSTRLGLRTIISWRCDSWILPLVWSTLPTATHVFAVVTWYFSRTMHRVHKEECMDIGRNQTTTGARGNAVLQCFAQEMTICAARKRRGFLQYRGREGFWVLFGSIGGSFLAFVSLMFGTLTLSSLLFITSSDALIVVVRYLASTLVCRLVLMFELGAMNAVERDTVDGPINEKRR